MHDTATLILAILGAALTWTLTIIGFAAWLGEKFRVLERTIYREMDKHRREDDRQFNQQGTKLQRLELKVFGFTNHPVSDPARGEFLSPNGEGK